MRTGSRWASPDSPAEKGLHRCQHQQPQEKKLEEEQQIAFKPLERRIHSLIAQHLTPQHQGGDFHPRPAQFQKIENHQRDGQQEKPGAGE